MPSLFLICPNPRCKGWIEKDADKPLSENEILNYKMVSGTMEQQQEAFDRGECKCKSVQKSLFE